jgi:hypothetical protein
MYKPAAILIAFVLFLTSCSDPATGGDDILKLGITPNLAFFQHEIYTCSAEMPGHVQVDVLPLNALISGEYTAIIHAGQSPRDSVFSTRVGNMKLRIIINPENPVSQIDPDDLAKILLGIQTDWQVLAPQNFPAPMPIHVWSYPAGDDIRGVVEGYFLEGRSITATSHLAPDSLAMLAAVLSDPSAIGFIVDDSYQSTGNTAPVDPKVVYTLELPILASFGSAPEGAIKELMVCLSKSGE